MSVCIKTNAQTAKAAHYTIQKYGGKPVRGAVRISFCFRFLVTKSGSFYVFLLFVLRRKWKIRRRTLTEASSGVNSVGRYTLLIVISWISVKVYLNCSCGVIWTAAVSRELLTDINFNFVLQILYPEDTT